MIFCNAYAKINLTLNILNKRSDNYHNISSIMQTISLHDVIVAEKTDELIKIICDVEEIPTDEKNIVFKIAKKFFEYTGINGGVEFYIKKNIPSKAGLGGGSSDGATALKLLNKLYDTKLSKEQMINISASVGADIPFFIVGGTALVEGIGEKVTILKDIPFKYVAVDMPYEEVQTDKAYELFDQKGKCSDNTSSKSFISMLTESRLDFSVCNNDFEQVIQCDLDYFNEYGALTSRLSGSGSAVYGIFDNLKDAQECIPTYLCFTIDKSTIQKELCE
ncbi:MAG: 4-(cytidine 5'-diphospho)-2-C-methyl-D-erythritol kinase [Oscillospiraceae bacterium]